MTDPRNLAHDKRVRHEKKRHRAGYGSDAMMHHRPGMKPHQTRMPTGHGPDADESIDQVETPVEQIEHQH